MSMLWNSSRKELYTAEWVVPGVLARSQRPGYPVNRPAASNIVAWAERVREMGVRGILCILDYPQLAHYDGLGLDGGGLLAYYRSLGFAVRHVTADDHKRPPLSGAELDQVWRAFRQLRRPVLVHCSAGRDRTGAALQHILGRLAAGE
jgi:hypothetical protein